MDKLSAEQRHKNMAAIRGKDTKPEIIVRRGLWKRGFRYRLNHKRLPGHPDLAQRGCRDGLPAVGPPPPDEFGDE